MKRSVVPLAGHGIRPTPLRRRASRPQLKRDPLGGATQSYLARANCRAPGHPISDSRGRDMKNVANARFTIKSWVEKPYSENQGVPKLTRAAVTKAFTGDIAGEGHVEYLMMYRSDGSATFVGLERVVGHVAGKASSFVLQRTGVFENGAAKAPSRRLYEPKDGYTEVRQGIHGRGTSRDEGACPRAEGGSAPRPAREAGGRGKRRAREDCRDAETGSRHGQAAPCHHQSQRASPLAENLVRDARVRQGRPGRLLLPKRAQVQGEVRHVRLQRQGEPRRRHRVAGRLRAEGADRRRRSKDRRAREESGELRSSSSQRRNVL